MYLIIPERFTSFWSRIARLGIHCYRWRNVNRRCRRGCHTPLSYFELSRRIGAQYVQCSLLTKSQRFHRIHEPYRSEGRAALFKPVLLLLRSVKDDEVGSMHVFSPEQCKSLLHSGILRAAYSQLHGVCNWQGTCQQGPSIPA